ncbi:MAG: SRPBCC family protein [Actinomycetota bacterium]|nr:SRPBCC family protein [Actinomycetota bacterium]
MSRAADRRARRVTRALGVVSLALGVGQLAAPREVARRARVDDVEQASEVVSLVGARQLVHAAGLLAGRSGWIWTRVAGDAVDLTLLAHVAGSRRRKRRQRARTATAAVAALTAVDLTAALAAGRARTTASRVEASITVNRPVGEVYACWRDIERLPQFMAHLESVRVTGDGRSRWEAKAPLRTKVAWDAEIVADRPDELLAWRSVGNAAVENSGTVRFAPAPGGRGTEVRVELHYAVPGGRVGATFAKLLGEEPERQTRDDLRRLKQVLETGEVVRSEASPEGTLARRQLGQRPAQPAA